MRLFEIFIKAICLLVIVLIIVGCTVTVDMNSDCNSNEGPVQVDKNNRPITCR